MTKTLIGILIITGAIGFGMLATCHAVVTGDGITIIEKQEPTFRHTVINLRDWTAESYQENWDLTLYLFRKGLVTRDVLSKLQSKAEEVSHRSLKEALVASKDKFTSDAGS